jgi:preprotein translocase subunit YajC
MPYLALILLQAQPASNPILSFLPLIFIVAIFYFLVFMPMQRQKKAQAEMLSTLEAGKEVLTTGGIVGTIVSINGDMMVLRVRPNNVKIQVARSAVASVVKSETAGDAHAPDQETQPPRTDAPPPRTRPSPNRDSGRSLYDVLEVSPNASKETIKAARKSLSQKYHPDKNSSRDTTQKMQEVNAAFEVLVDPVRRASYDAKMGFTRQQENDEAPTTEAKESAEERK